MIITNNQSTPLVSIIIRARDEARGLSRLLPLLAQQKTDFPFEIWVLDNESQDETASVARAYQANIHVIPRNAFNYSTALNLGAELARGSIVVNLSAHCFPQSDHWLAYLVEPLRRDETICATYGRQWIDAQLNPYEGEGNDAFFPPTGQQPLLVAFSNANAAIRKSILLQHPFNPHVKILEDHLFYLELSPYYTFQYVPEAFVHHEHDSFSMRYYFKRWPLEGWAFHFIMKQRDLATPFKTNHFFAKGALQGYYQFAQMLHQRGRKKAALATVPFFILREIFWVQGWLKARLMSPLTAYQDRAFLYAILSNRPPDHDLRINKIKGVTPQFIENHTGQDISHWPEEWQLKADWAFIRQNVADFIRYCYDSDTVFQNPLLEVGASGQNDYLGEKYSFLTSNLDYNKQGAELSLDMEDMHQFEANSIGSILCSEVVEHVKHIERALAEAFRVLKPGGTLIITTPYAIVIHNTPDDGGFHGCNFTPQGLELRLIEAGFKVRLLETRGATPTRRQLLPSNLFAIAEKPSS